MSYTFKTKEQKVSSFIHNPSIGIIDGGEDSSHFPTVLPDVIKQQNMSNTKTNGSNCQQI